MKVQSSAMTKQQLAALQAQLQASYRAAHRSAHSKPGEVAFTSYGVPVFPAPVWFHGSSQCSGEWCVIHSPSAHPLNLAPIYLDARTICYRVCEHGIRHPDPDSKAYFARRYTGGPLIRHNKKCDGCCT